MNRDAEMTPACLINKIDNRYQSIAMNRLILKIGELITNGFVIIRFSSMDCEQ